MPTIKTQEHAAVEKPHTKPGRKPIMSEPKNKRTAQNRAAQRAFRERKERRMQELEEKVKLLEQEKSQIANESELLRIQVKALMKQLGKSPIDDIEVKGLNNTIIDDDKSSIRRSSLSDDRYISSSSSISSTTPGSIISEDFYSFPKPNNILLTNTPSDVNTTKDLDLQLSDKLNNKSFKDHYDEHIFCKELSQVCGSSSCPIPKLKLATTTSSSESSPSIINGSSSIGTVNSTQNNDINSNNNNNNNNDITNSLFESTSPITSPSIISSSKSTNIAAPYSNSFLDTKNDFNTNFNINDKIINKKEDNLSWETPDALDSYAFLDNNKNDEMDFLFDDSNKIENTTNTLFDHKPNTLQFNKLDTPINNNNNNIDNFNNLNYGDNNDDSDDKKKINNDGFDLDFDNDDIFDDLLKLPYEDNNLSIKNDDKPTDTNNNGTKDNNSNINNTDNEDDEKVPDTTHNLMKCSQIWERITSHPRFTDLDIDNLCEELKQKAKCSESGVVVDGSDVGKLLHKATCEKQKELEKNRETDIKRLAMNPGSNSFLAGFW